MRSKKQVFLIVLFIAVVAALLQNRHGTSLLSLPDDQKLVARNLQDQSVNVAVDVASIEKTGTAQAQEDPTIVAPDTLVARESTFYRFEELEEKFLKQPSEVNEWNGLLSNGSLLTYSSDLIQRSTRDVLEAQEELERFSAVRFLGAALASTDPNTREVAVQKVLPLLSMPVWSASMSTALRQSLLADRLELFAIAAQKMPQLIKTLIQNATTEKEKQFVDLAQKWSRYRWR